MNKVRKFVPVMLTPFDERGGIDYPALAKLTEYYIEAGAKGLFANCLSSEMFELTDEERISITKHVVQVAGGSVPVVSTGTFGGSLDKQADFIKRIHDTGVSAVIAINSILAEAGESDQVLDERVFTLLDKTDNIPIGFYECPVPYKRLFSADQLRALVSTGRVKYYKDTSLRVDDILNKLTATKEFEAFELYDAHMPNAVASLKVGCAGLSCIQGNFSPELVTWLAENFDNDALKDEVNKVQQFFTETLEVMHTSYPAVAKYFLKQKGLPVGLYTRRNTGTVTDSVRQRIDKLIGQCDEILSELGIITRIDA